MSLIFSIKMDWADEGILLNTLPQGERSALLQVFTSKRGLHAGLVRNAYSPKIVSTLQPSSQLSLNWSSRIEENLGTFKVELIKTRADTLMFNQKGLAAFNSLSALCISILAERDPMPELYSETIRFLDQISSKKNWEFFYLGWELKLLSAIGFGLDLEKCAVTEVREGLIYISPKSGKAICKEVGEKYHSKLLPFPSILRKDNSSNNPSYLELVKGLSVTGFFIEKWLDFSIEKKKTLIIRKRFINLLSAQYTG